MCGNFELFRLEVSGATHALLGRIPGGLEGYWGGDDNRRILYGCRHGTYDLEKWLGPGYLLRTGFCFDRNHVLKHHFDQGQLLDKSKFGLSFAQVAELCPNVLRFPNRVRLFRQGVLFGGVFDGDLGGGNSVLKVWVDAAKDVPIRSFYLDKSL